MSNRDLEIMADERLQAEAVALRKQVRGLLALCLDCWTQFANDTGAGYDAGGLSTLERLYDELLEAGLIDEAGRVATR